HDDVRQLLDNEWLTITVVDPEQDHRLFHYDGELEWVSRGRDSAAYRAEQAPARSPTDD
ncbi:MAG: hypothetical protein A07HR60_02527, partial [uncultured archaeon A07HR60]